MSVRDLIILGCSSQQPTRYRNHGAYLVRWNEEGFLFDPGEGTQRQFIHADIAPPVVNRIFISHFHGDHCLGFGSMLMRLNLDKVAHQIHCYYPASGKKYFDRLRYAAMYHETIQVVEHPVSQEGIVDDDGRFKIEAFFLQHGVDNIAWRITEADRLKFDKKKLAQLQIVGLRVRQLKEQGYIDLDGQRIALDDVSWIRTGDTFAIVLDTRFCANAIKAAQGAKLLVCESTYLQAQHHLAHNYFHMTAQQAATVAQQAQAERLVLTHFSARYNNLKEFEEEARTVFANTFIAKDFKSFPF